MTEKESHCSFCGKHKNYVQKLIGANDRFNGVRVYICDECVEMCSVILKNKANDTKKVDEIDNHS